jgi:ABC-type branched-subunit amino acid transport system permease subunit
MPQDEEHLRLLSIFHYIVAGLAALFSFFPLLYSGFGVLMLYASSHPQHQQGEPPPPVVGWLFIAFGSLLFLAGLTLATCIALSGKFIARRRRYWFAFVTACVECLFFPFGIILGVFTIIVLSRNSVKRLFGVEPPSSPATARV